MIAFGSMDANGESTQSGHIESLTLAQPLVTRQYPDIYVPKDSINKIFTDLNDLRFGLDTTAKIYRINYFTNYSGEIPIFSKIKVLRDGVSDGSFSLFGSIIPFTRLEKIMLLRAEAFAVINRRSDAMEALNVVRTSRGLPTYNESSPENIVDAIFSERRRELMGEGWRWYDQVRYQKIMHTSSVMNELIRSNGIYWPVSSNILNQNNLLVQNSYWN